MKRMVIIIGGFILFMLMLWFGAKTMNNLSEKERKEDLQSSLRNTLVALGVNNLTNKPTALLFFNSECEHCQWEVKEISKKIDLFKTYQLAFVSFEPPETALKFLSTHGLDQFYLETAPEKVMTTFSGGVPQTFIYKNDQLVQHFQGEVKIEAIINALAD